MMNLLVILVDNAGTVFMQSLTQCCQVGGSINYYDAIHLFKQLLYSLKQEMITCQHGVISRLLNQVAFSPIPGAILDSYSSELHSPASSSNHLL